MANTEERTGAPAARFCPVSKALIGNVEVRLTARLER
jgi:organic hydroperoxide reductase OsmC/OhrA